MILLPCTEMIYCKRRVLRFCDLSYPINPYLTLQHDYPQNCMLLQTVNPLFISIQRDNKCSPLNHCTVLFRQTSSIRPEFPAGKFCSETSFWQNYLHISSNTSTWLSRQGPVREKQSLLCSFLKRVRILFSGIKLARRMKILSSSSAPLPLH